MAILSAQNVSVITAFSCITFTEILITYNQNRQWVTGSDHDPLTHTKN